ncbi:hypothetical protein BCON_0414g00010 [Botryotinia convoluta]|uniref:Uncharacterized protein n=1 Tax=Botryotinia convoluta TaxID=54673 RepID=A0A4Z1H7Y4_9HELO|nr:hypothetical protein BCON_0414g00010 [Botryotinia convoluta]
MKSKIKSPKSRIQRNNKLKEGESKADPVTQLHKFCQQHNCDDPKYVSEHRKLTLVLSGTHIFNNIPEFRPKKKFKNHAEGKVDVAKQALRWIQENPSPSLYWKDPKTAELVTDIIAELAEGVYENGTDKKAMIDFMEFLKKKAKDKLRDRLEKKGVPKTSCGTPQYTRALEVCRLSHVSCTAASAYPEIICAPNVVFKEIPKPIISTIKPALAQENTALSTATDILSPALNVGAMGNIALVKDLDDTLRLLTAIISQDGYKFLDRLQVLSNRHGKKRLEFLQYLMDFFSEDLIKDISGDFLRGERTWTEKNMAQFSQVQSKDLLGVFNSVASSLGYKSEEHLKLFLSWHQNGMFKTITDLSKRVGAKTQHYLEKLLELEGAGLFTIMDEATTISEGKPARLLSSYICRQTDDISQRLRKIEEQKPGKTSQILSDALRYHQLNIFREINTLIGDSSDGQRIRNHFISLLTVVQAVKDVVATIEQLVPTGILTNNGTTPISQGAQAPNPDSTPAPIIPSSDEQRQLPPATTNPGLKPKSRFSLPGSKLPAPSSKASSSSSKKAKKADTTLPEATTSTERPILARGKCIKCPRLGYKIFQDGKLLCEECRNGPY